MCLLYMSTRKNAGKFKMPKSALESLDERYKRILPGNLIVGHNYLLVYGNIVILGKFIKFHPPGQEVYAHFEKLKTGNIEVFNFNPGHFKIFKVSIIQKKYLTQILEPLTNKETGIATLPPEILDHIISKTIQGGGFSRRRTKRRKRIRRKKKTYRRRRSRRH